MGVVYVLCLRVAPSVTPLEPTRPEAVLNWAFHPEAPFAQAVTVAYKPVALTVMSWVALPTSTGTGKSGFEVAAPLSSAPAGAAAVVSVAGAAVVVAAPAPVAAWGAQ
ncbi:hypothetical protein ACFU6I_47505, partial [Streptomyces sp. NPDC057486]|uniref:hypothetical protein n=1 Tax=Streptomyces sp. NPDC057486 TaxID=3346145 RepID=UPI003677EE4A